MMFVQYLIWGAWAPTLGNYMQTIEMGQHIALAYALGPLAAIVAPFFLGMVADRFFDSEKVLGALFLVAGVSMAFMPSVAETMPGLFLPLLGLHALCYWPTLGLTASLAFHHLDNQEKEFPVVRVFGTLGWAAIGTFMGYVLQQDSSPTGLYIGAGAAVVLGLYSFTLPHTPPPSAGQTTSWRQIAGFDAFRELKSPSFVVFLAAAMLIFIAFGTYFPYAPVFFQDLNQTLSLSNFSNPSFEMSFGQWSEIVFMLLIPFFFARLGIKWMLLLGMLAWVLRFTLFASAAMTGTFWVIMIGILVHGICYDFFFVTGQIYLDKKTTPEIRGQVQGLLVLLTQGVGFFLGTQLSGFLVNRLSETGSLALGDWRTFWFIFAGLTVVFTLFFAIFFKVKEDVAPSTDIKM